MIDPTAPRSETEVETETETEVESVVVAEPALVAIADIEQQFAAMYQWVKAGLRDRAGRLHPDLSPLGFQLVRVLAHRGPMHAGRLADTLEIDKSIVSRQAAQLVELGLLERTRDSHDARAVYLDLTETARTRIDQVRADDARSLRQGLADWEVVDLESLAALLRRMNDSIGGASTG